MFTFHSCGSGSADAYENADDSFEIIAATYPEEAVRTITVSDAKEICRKITTETDPSLNKGLPGSGIYMSPYYTLQVNDTEVPVYSTAVYSPSINGSGGALHSFARIEVKSGMQDGLTVLLSPLEDLSVKMAAVTPESLNVVPAIENGAIRAVIQEYGHYTFMVNGDDQRYAFTLSVTEYADEDAEIAALQERFPENGSGGVTVFEPGVHYVDPMTYIGVSGKAVYIKRGALVIAEHKYDLNTAEDSQKYNSSTCPEEDDGCGGLGIGLPRRAVLGVNSFSGIVIAGHGTIDFSMLDLNERNGIAVTYSRDIEIRDITLINAAAWTVTVYNCDNVSIDNVVTYSWRVSSDSFDLCNSRNVLVEDCFSRGGDDIYVVKTLGGADTAVAENNTVRNCIAWAGKARAFSIASEACKDFRNIVFEDCSVVVHDSVWNTDYVAALAIVLETMEDDTPLENKGAVDMKFDAKNQNNTITAVLKQVSVGSTLLTGDNLAEHAEILGGAAVNIP